MNAKKAKRRVLVVIIAIFIAIAIVIADSILFYTSLQDTGVGRGFSRYWDSRE